MSSTMPCNSSGLCLCSAAEASRRVRDRLGGGSSSLTLSACGRRPDARPNSTFCPALRTLNTRRQGRRTDVDVLAVLLGQEAETFLDVVPLHLAGRHWSHLLV